MENRAAVDAEDIAVLRAIGASLAAINQTIVANQACPWESPYGPYVDAVARKAAAYWTLTELTRVDSRLAALKQRLLTGHEQGQSGPRAVSDPAGTI